MTIFHIFSKTYFLLTLFFFSGFSVAETSVSKMTEAAKAAQNIQNKLYPQIQLQFTYNYNQNMGANNGSQQDQFELNPIIPISLGNDLQLILNPMLTYNHNLNDQQMTNQNQPLQLATFFMPTYAKYWYGGIGPYLQLPATNSNNGSMQTGIGVSAGAFFMPDNWVIGGVLYQSWGVGHNLSGGSATLINFQPSISYTTDNAWTYTISSQLNYNYTASETTNQLTLSGGKTIKMLGHHFQFQIGPTYMVTTNSTSAKGFGGYFGLTMLLPK